MLPDIIAESELIIWNKIVQTCRNSKNQQGSYSECALDYTHIQKLKLLSLPSLRIWGTSSNSRISKPSH